MEGAGHADLDPGTGSGRTQKVIVTGEIREIFAQFCKKCHLRWGMEYILFLKKRIIFCQKTQYPKAKISTFNSGF